MSQPFFVRSLSRAERKAIRKLRKRPPNVEVYRRTQAVYFSSKGLKVQQIAEIVGRSRISVTRWLHEFDTHGLVALWPGKSTGRPPKADADFQAALVGAIEQNPHDLGHPFTRWSADLLTEHLRRKLHVDVSCSTVYNTLKRLGYRYGRPKLDLKHRQGPERRPKGQKTEESCFKKTKASAGRCAFAYCDEAEFHLNPRLSRCWSARGRRVIVPSAGVNRKVPVFGALDAMTGEVTVLVTEKKRSGEFLDFLHWLVEDIYGDRGHIYLFLDNCSIHHTKAVREYIYSHKSRRYVTSRVARKLFMVRTDKSGKFAFTNLPVDATAELLFKKIGLATVNTFDRSRYPAGKLQFAPGQDDIKLVVPAEAKIEGIVVEKS